MTLGLISKTFDFYIHENINVCIFDKIFYKQAEGKALKVKKTLKQHIWPLQDLRLLKFIKAILELKVYL